MVKASREEIWKGDLLGFAARGEAFTNLVTSIDDHRTISIEAGYGRGKTFYRKRWAQELEAAGECVVQIDARLSDHSGDPVVTFLGALLGTVPEKDQKKLEALFSIGKKVAIAGAKAVARAALREGADELSDALASEDGQASSLQDIAKAAGQDLSKAAGDLIATQLSAEKARLELAEQLKNLHTQITAGRSKGRIIILIDELDRCHPDYAIALLEAMKLVFDQDGFVFVLMVNREYLEKIAEHRFGTGEKGEFYLDKFVDLRLKLEAENEVLSEAVSVLAAKLPLEIPFGDHSEFGVERAAKLAGELAPVSGLSMRQIERLLGKVELACRVYKTTSIDLPLLFWLAFQDFAGPELKGTDLPALKRAALTPEFCKGKIEALGGDGHFLHESRSRQIDSSLTKEYPELAALDSGAFRPPDARTYFLWVQIYEHLAPYYIPEHQAMLDAVHKLQVVD